MRFNRQAFFDGYRGIAGSLSQSQVEGIEFLLDKIEEDSEWENIPQIAYVLSTTEHETARTFRPIKEYRSKPGSKGRARQDKYWMTGYMGRGFVQLTHKENYEHYGIADEPSLAMEPEKAYEILSDGMRNGVFTGKKLGDYVNRGRKDYFNARKVVNGLDKAQQIADRARAFESILLESAELAESETETEEPTRHHAAPRAKPVVHASPDQPDKQMDDKGVTTSPDKPKDETSGTPPPAPAMEVKASQPSIFSRIGSLSLPAGMMTVLGGIATFMQSIPVWVWVVMGSVALLSGVYLWNEAQRRAHERTMKVMSAAASPESNNLRLV